MDLDGAWGCALRPSSPLDYISAVPALAHGAPRPGKGERQGDSVTTGNGVVLVDDFILTKLVRVRAVIFVLVGGCAICLQYRQQAEAVDDTGRCLGRVFAANWACLST